MREAIRQSAALPESMNVIIETIGLSAAISVAQVFAGSKIWVPKRDALTEHHPLSRLLGMPLAYKIADRFGGSDLVVAQCQRMLLEQRDAEIVRRRDAGESAFELAQAYGLADRSIRSILARARDEAES